MSCGQGLLWAAELSCPVMTYQPCDKHRAGHPNLRSMRASAGCFPQPLEQWSWGETGVDPPVGSDQVYESAWGLDCRRKGGHAAGSHCSGLLLISREHPGKACLLDPAAHCPSQPTAVSALVGEAPRPALPCLPSHTLAHS